jgi:hypothetical protein
LDLQNSFEDRECNADLPVSRHIFIKFSQNLFEKQQAAICFFSKEFCANPGIELINRKKGIQNKIVHTLAANKKVLQI